jgi:hypothetical protein
LALEEQPEVMSDTRWLLLQSTDPAAAAINEVYLKPNTANLGTRSQNAEAELEAIISSRMGGARALPKLTASPALLVSQLPLLAAAAAAEGAGTPRQQRDCSQQQPAAMPAWVLV